MSDLLAAPRARLFTTFGTSLYVDGASGQLRHGPIGSSPTNATFVLDASSEGNRRRGRFVREQGGSQDAILCSTTRCIVGSRVEGSSRPNPPALLDLVPLGRGLFAFTTSGLFLCAESDGRITLSRAACSLWECFLCSEDWLAGQPATDENQIQGIARDRINRNAIDAYVIPPQLKAHVKCPRPDTLVHSSANDALPQPREPAAPLGHRKVVARVLFFTGVGWAFGSVHHELVKYLHSRGMVADILDWARHYNRDEVRMMGDYYDCIVGIPGETWPLTDNYGIPHEKIVVVAHGDYDLRHALDTRPREEFDRFAGYGVLSDYLRQLSADLGIRRVPKIVKYGVNFRRFFAPLSSELKVVGYGGSMERKDHAGVEWKRGSLAQQAAEAAGLIFRPAGKFHFLAMPQYYRQVDAVLVSSLNEGFGLPAVEAAAAGRLVISTPVGGFLELGSRGGGITAPLDPLEYKEFVAEKLRYYRDHATRYVDLCRGIQESARRFDWEYTIDDWIDLMESA